MPLNYVWMHGPFKQILGSAAPSSPAVGSQHPSPNVKTFCKFEPQIWLELSHHVMPKVLVLKVRGRHVER